MCTTDRLESVVDSAELLVLAVVGLAELSSASPILCCNTIPSDLGDKTDMGMINYHVKIYSNNCLPKTSFQKRLSPT